jgi:hypothetical protein
MAKQGGFDSAKTLDTTSVDTYKLLKIRFNIAICGFPFEITTVASWRLKKH